MKNTFIYILTITIIFTSACSSSLDDNDGEIIAKVNDIYLYKSDVSNLISENTTQQDSITITDNYINMWVKNQLKFQAAEKNLPSEQKDIEKLINDYKSSLLIYKYEQMLIKQKLDTTITDEEIEEYYNLNKSNFLLDQEIVKVLFVQTLKDAPNKNKLKKWCKSDKEEDFLNLNDYCINNSERFFFEDNWLYFSQLQKELPSKIDNVENYLKNKSFIETSDSIYNYYINIKDYRIKNDTTPLVYVKDNIRSIILNKRKYEFIIRLENNLYEENKKNIEINK